MMCQVCKRVTVHINKSCFDHSDWPKVELKPEYDPRLVKYVTKAPSQDVKPVAYATKIVLSERVKPTLDALLDMDLSAMVPVRDPNKHYCSFCGDEVPQSRLTIGTGSLRKIFQTEIIKNSAGKIIDFRDKMIHTTDKLKACPEHCLLIKPTISKKNGGFATKGTEFGWNFD